MELVSAKSDVALQAAAVAGNMTCCSLRCLSTHVVKKCKVSSSSGMCGEDEAVHIMGSNRDKAKRGRKR